MTKRIAPVPRGYRTVTPQIVVRGADAALAYYAEVFGATVESRIPTEDGLAVLQAEIKVGNSIVRVMDEMPAFGILAPANFGGAAVGLHLYMPNTDEVWERATASGAGILVPLADMPWGERYGKFIDPFGHVWSIARRIAHKPAADKAKAEVVETAPESFSVHEPQADAAAPSLEKEMAAESNAA